MSSKTRKVNKEIVARRIETVVEVLSLMEAEAKKKSFGQRFVISMQYLFTGKINVFFKEGGKRGKAVEDNQKQA